MRPADAGPLEPRPRLLPLQVHRGLPRRRPRAPAQRLRQGGRRSSPDSTSWLAELFDDDHVDDTCERLAGVSEPDPAADEREAALRAAIADCDRKLANYRALLDHEDAVTVAAAWIADTQRERKQLERQLGQHVPGDQLTPEQVKALVKALKDIVGVLAEADPADKADLYDQLGISLAYDPDGTVTVESRPRGVQRTCRRGDLNPHALAGTRPST